MVWGLRYRWRVAPWEEAPASSELRVACEEAEVAGSELLVASGNTSAAGASGPATSYSSLATPAAHHNSCDDDLREGEFYAVKNVSFELRRGECLGLIGHNGAGNQAAGQLLGRLPQVARRVRRRGKARINTTLLKMLNGLIKPDRGTITMRGRIASLLEVGTGFNPILTGREPEGWEACRTRRLGKALGRLPLAARRVR